ncbi:ABC transporter permease [Dehalobacterium formicoaceticum]|uniref:ABC transporter permease n=1 Tax=Dehalobacterium formicoaceticum TaxID=51515 RepID=UPI0031F6F9C8
MYYRIIRNDIGKNKLITATIVAFVAAAAMLISLAAILIINLGGAIDTLMEQAKTPHFLQMHTGTLDADALDAFAKGQADVDEYQILEFLNIDGAQIEASGNTLASSVQDNGFSVQSPLFDYLLDLNGNIIRPADGEVYLPLVYWKDGFSEIGDILSVHGHPLTVAGFLRDSQMNASLSSSKRFLVSESDFEVLRQQGSIEYLIEFRLHDMGRLGEFENAYLSAGLPANGPRVTYPLFRMINALSDGMMIGVILLVSLLAVAIAFLCIRFTLLTKIEEDYREIGVMKAIGLRVSDIKGLYLAKYAAIAAVGCLLGLGLSFVFRGALLENIRLYMGESGNDGLSLVLGFAGSLAVFLAIVSYVSVVLRRFRKISAASALRFGASQENMSGVKRLTLSGRTFPPTNVFLGVKDVLSRKKLYVTMLVVLVLAAFILIVPQNLYNTISTAGFARYMGIGQSDMRIDIQQTIDISDKAAQIAQVMEQDDDIDQFVVLTTKAFTVREEDGTEVRLNVELGDHTVFPIEYVNGTVPILEDEIALSSINGDELNKTVGDTISIVTSLGMKQLTVTGIYSDVTNGGKTAKAAFSDDGADIMWCVISASFFDQSRIEDKVDGYARRFEFAKVSDIAEYMEQTFGGSIQAIGKASQVAAAVALVITVLVVLLFMKMLLAKDHYAVAVMKALGFTEKDIRTQYLTRSLFVLVFAVALGVLLANTLGGLLAGLVISSLGVASFRFAINPIVSYLLCPLALIAATLAATMIGTARTGEIKIMESIKE